MARYIVALRAELKLQFRQRDIDRIAAEVESHLDAAIEDANAATEESAAAVVSAFGSPADLGSAYRRSGIRVIAQRAARGDNKQQPLTPSTRVPRNRMVDFMNFAQLLKNLARNPGFAAIIVATLALGITANAVILSVVNAVLLNPLPFADADRLVRVYHSAPALTELPDIGLSQSSYFFFRDTGVLEDLAIFNEGGGNLSGGDEPQQVDSLTVSHSFFDVLGIPPLLGRTFNEDDEDPGAPEVIILSEPLWRTNFGGRDDLIGETVMLDSETVEIVGVMPDTVHYPSRQTGVFEPMTLSREFRTLGSLGTASVGRMKPDMTPDAAGAQLAARIANLEEAFPDEPAAPVLAQGGLTAHAEDLRANMVGDIENNIWLLMGSVGFILLIACANVANVFLVRAEGREREMAIRAAMGASRGRLTATLLAESAVLSLIAGGVALLLAPIGVYALVSFGPQDTPRINEIGLDGTVIGATMIAALFAGLLFGLIPVLRYNAAWLSASLKEGGRANTAGRASFRLRGALVGAQVALALILLVGSGLMVRSYASLSAIDLGFNRESVLTFSIALNPQDYEGEVAPAQFIQRAIDAIAEMPGVVHVGAASALPLNDVRGQGYAIEDHPLGEGDLPPVHPFKFVSGGYFETMGIPVVAGRPIERVDYESRRSSVVVNETFARTYWPDQDPLGRRLQQGGGSQPRPDDWYEIVGVVGDVRGNALNSSSGPALEAPPAATVYFGLVAKEPVFDPDDPENRLTGGFGGGIRTPMFVVRTSGTPTALVDPIRQRIWDLDDNLPIANAQTMIDLVDADLERMSFTMMLLLAGAIGALLIGAVGIYGVISYLVAQRTREIGVRMALGARTEDIGRMVLRRSLIITGAGIATGLLGSLLLTEWMASYLFGVDPLDLRGRHRHAAGGRLIRRLPAGAPRRARRPHGGAAPRLIGMALGARVRREIAPSTIGVSGRNSPAGKFRRPSLRPSSWGAFPRIRRRFSSWRPFQRGRALQRTTRSV